MDDFDKKFIDPKDPVNAQVLAQSRDRQAEVEAKERREATDLGSGGTASGTEKLLYGFADADHPVKGHREDGQNWSWTEKGLHQVVDAPLEKLPKLAPEDTTPETDPDNAAARRDRAEKERRGSEAKD